MPPRHARDVTSNANMNVCSVSRAQRGARRAHVGPTSGRLEGDDGSLQQTDCRLYVVDGVGGERSAQARFQVTGSLGLHALLDTYKMNTI